MKYKLIVLALPLISYSALPPASKRMRVAITRGKIRDVKQCLDSGETPVRIWPRGGMTPLMVAVKWNKTEIAQLFTTIQLEEQARLENDSKQTPLHFAAEAGNIPVLSALIDAQAEIDHIDANGIPPLFAAVKGVQIHNKPENIQAIKLLLEAEAYPKQYDQKLWNLVINTQNQEVINLLAPYFIKQKIG